MKRTIITIIAGLMLISQSFAQLSQRQNDATNLKLGTRPTSGDLSLTFALPLTSGGIADLSLVNTLGRGDFVSMKYYIQSNVAIRGAIQLYKDSESGNGDLVIPATNAADGSVEYKSSYKEYTIAPGIEKHFSAANIFDVYTGADAYIGYAKSLDLNNLTDVTGDYFNSKTTSSHVVLGLGTVVGVCIFVAQLPVSVGIEYGLNFKYSNEGKTHYVDETSVGGTVTTQDYYTSSVFPGSNFSKVSQNMIGINTNENVRIVLNVYFGK